MGVPFLMRAQRSTLKAMHTLALVWQGGKLSCWKVLLVLISLKEVAAFVPLSSLHLRPALAAHQGNCFVGSSSLAASSVRRQRAAASSILDLVCKARPRKGFQPRRRLGDNSQRGDIFNLNVATAPIAPEVAPIDIDFEAALAFEDIERMRAGDKDDATLYCPLRSSELLDSSSQIEFRIDSPMRPDPACNTWRFVSGSGRGGKEYTVAVNEKLNITLELAHASSAVMLQSSAGKIQRCWGDGDLYERFTFMGSEELHSRSTNGEGQTLRETLFDPTKYGGWTLSEHSILDGGVVLRGVFKQEEAVIFLSESGLTVTGTGQRCVVVEGGKEPTVIPASRLPDHYQRFVAKGRERRATEESRPEKQPVSTMAAGRARMEAEELPSEFRCPISGDVVWDAVVAADGHTYSESAFMARVAGGNLKSAVTGKTLAHCEVVPNMLIRSILEAECQAMRAEDATQAGQEAFQVDEQRAGHGEDDGQQLQRQVKALEAEVALLRARVASSDRRRERERGAGRLRRSQAIVGTAGMTEGSEADGEGARAGKGGEVGGGTQSRVEGMAGTREEASEGRRRRRGAEEWRRKVLGDEEDWRKVREEDSSVVSEPQVKRAEEEEEAEEEWTHVPFLSVGRRGLRQGRWAERAGRVTVAMEGGGQEKNAVDSAAALRAPYDAGVSVRAESEGITTAKREGRAARRAGKGKGKRKKALERRAIARRLRHRRSRRNKH